MAFRPYRVFFPGKAFSIFAYEKHVFIYKDWAGNQVSIIYDCPWLFTILNTHLIFKVQRKY